MITMSIEFASMVKELLEKLKSSDDKTERLRLDIVREFDLWINRK